MILSNFYDEVLGKLSTGNWYLSWFCTQKFKISFRVMLVKSDFISIFKTSLAKEKQSIIV